MLAERTLWEMECPGTDNGRHLHFPGNYRRGPCKRRSEMEKAPSERPINIHFNVGIIGGRPCADYTIEIRSGLG